MLKKLWHKILCFFNKHVSVADSVPQGSDQKPALRCDWCGQYMDIPGRGAGL